MLTILIYLFICLFKILNVHGMEICYTLYYKFIVISLSGLKLVIHYNSNKFFVIKSKY
ncbi:hypothetical protein GLOIN_2v1496978 [Rhizophagus irregularis DAOM 181602=DAOM 197198]|uniref:Uncharacterized protein n=1 Tax=Rhizophagus irregularis (strain DAOM 181602 / DAOM 197198 / MUCL 43194) TaxID=747089 RepID=A0A2P4QYB2_RHIID|nr:hypothetical protein GLOIN_2v1496978 [Rhizophagus irregularis DAOM 181602=DAOM 197198]POG82644.1 hypothetical protein GLOIN_2v1496978 [Rhizophagus irregularis DAOM 181602=DAOM 197198]|eukprot:XP_025189510.1 hypothetical protein GLOIN_2v1496978 [Rhizophagus irregularis DAOM 181602=DAOM 197198]